MGKVNLELRGASILETIVASVIFMFVFVVSVDVVSRIVTKNDNYAEVIDMEHRMELCRKEFTASDHECGKYVRESRNGVITVTLGKYKDYDRLLELDIVGEMKSTGKRIVHSHIIEKTNDGYAGRR